MRITTKLKIGVFLCVVAAFCFSAAIYWMFREERVVVERVLESSEMSEGIFQLNLLTHDFLLHPEKRIIGQWKVKYANLGENLDALELAAEAEGTDGIPDSLRKNLIGINELFMLLTGLQANGKEPDEIAREKKERLAAQLLVKSQAAFSDAQRLHDLNINSARLMQERAGLLVTLMIAVLLVIVISMSFFITRAFASPMKRLREAIEITANGNLDHKVGLAGKDEFGQLSRSFDEMSARLKSSYEKLEEEYATRRRAEDALRESERKYATLVEKGNDAIVIVQDGVFKFVSSKMRDFTGFAREEMIGRKITEFITPEYSDLVMERFRKRVAGIRAPERYEIEILMKDGESIPVEVSASLKF
ncbi:MAG: PAS domain S-box protein [Deltaproteobacteria bacterium]|nr:PAS domain S-box protein [Deltaproteobacteria bacterium]